MSANEVKILHCADLHLGVEFATLGDKAGLRKRENFLAFERIISVCKEENVDFLLIAGDLFDHLHIDAQLVTEVMGLIARIPDTIVAITPGNHDPFSIDSCYYNRTWPENARIFHNELSYCLFEKKNICLWGAGFESTYHPESFLAFHPEDLDDNRINICLVHGDLVSQGQASLYNPLTKELIRQSRFDYIAMGHVHKRTAVMREGKTWYAYSGPPEGHGFDEPGEQGVYLGTLSKNALSLNFRRICSRCYHEVPVLIEDIRINQEIASRILHTLKERFAEEAKDHLYKILLKGEVPETMTIDPEYIAQKIASDCFYAKIENQTVIALDYETLSKEQTLKGIFVRKMREEIASAASKNDDAAALLARNALQYGLMAFEGEVDFDED